MFSTMRSSILQMNPPPSIKKAYIMITTDWLPKKGSISGGRGRGRSIRWSRTNNQWRRRYFGQCFGAGACWLVGHTSAVKDDLPLASGGAKTLLLWWHPLPQSIFQIFHRNNGVTCWICWILKNQIPLPLILYLVRCTTLGFLTLLFLSPDKKKGFL